MSMTPSRHQQNQEDAYWRRQEAMGFERPPPHRHDKYDGPPMDLANMRSNGVRELSASCRSCHHTARVNMDAYPGSPPCAVVRQSDALLEMRLHDGRRHAGMARQRRRTMMCRGVMTFEHAA